VIGWLLSGLKGEEWIAAGVVVLAALAIYVVTLPSRRRRTAVP
jgi:hypothetical protein